MSSLTGAVRESAMQWAESCAEAARRLRATAELTDSPLAASPGWLSSTVETLITIADLERAAVEISAPHAQPIAVRPAYEPQPLEL